MKTLKKVSFFILAILPFIPLAASLFAMYRNGDLVTLTDAFTMLGDFITLDQSSALGSVFASWLNVLSDSFGVGGDCVLIALTYIGYLLFIELTFIVVDVVMWIPRKMKYIMEVNEV